MSNPHFIGLPFQNHECLLQQINVHNEERKDNVHSLGHFLGYEYGTEE